MACVKFWKHTNCNPQGRVNRQHMRRLVTFVIFETARFYILSPCKREGFDASPEEEFMTHIPMWDYKK